MAQSTPKMAEEGLLRFLQRLDQALERPTEITVMGAAALIILGMRDRMTMDVDVWAEVNQKGVDQAIEAARRAGVPISNDTFDEPDEPYLQIVDRRAAHMPLDAGWLETRTPLWSGNLLTVLMPPLEFMAASKLSLGRDRDLDDVRFIFSLDPGIEQRIVAAASSFSNINRENILGNLGVVKLLSGMDGTNTLERENPGPSRKTSP